MRKIYSLFLVLLMLPMLAVAQTNLAIMGQRPTVSNYTSHQRIRVPVEAAGIMRLTQETLENRETTATNYSIGLWFNLSSYYQNSGWASNDNKTILADLGTHANSNANGNWVLCINKDGKLLTQGHGGSDQHGISSVGASNGAIADISLNEWHYLLFIVDNTNLKLQIYLDGTKVQDTNMSKVMIYDWADDYDLHFAGLGFIGSLDEIQLFNKALTEDEVAKSQVNANAISALTALYTFDEEESTGTFANKAANGNASYKAVHNIETGTFYSEGGLVPVRSSTPTTPVLGMGREIPVTEANITIQQPTEGGTFSVSDGENTYTSDFTTMTGTELTLNATPADGYHLLGFYTVDGETQTKIEGNTFTPTADATLTARFTAETYTLTVENVQEIPYTLTYNGAPADLAAMLGGGAEYVLTLTVPDNKVLNAVRLSETELMANTNGQYTFSMSADATLTIDARAKALYAVTITQPTEGGTISASNNGVAVASGEEVLEGTVLTLSNTPEIGYLFANYTVNGNAITGNSVTVNSAVTISGEFGEGVEYCIPEGRATRTDRGITSLTVTESGKGNTVTVTGGGTAYARNLYKDQTSVVLTTTPGATITIKDNGTGTWMSNYVYIDFNKNGVFEFDQAACAGANVDGELVSHTGFSNNASNPTVASDGSTIDWNNCFNITLPTFVIPADLAPGDYRIRHKLDWNCVDPCGRLRVNGFNDNLMDANGGGVIDFTIRIESNDYETPRTITVASANEELGTVAITSPATDEKSISTVQKAVTVEATPAATAAFKNWTNDNDEEVSTEAIYTYSGETDITLTANFGHLLNVEVAAGGSIGSIVNAETSAAIANHSVVDPNTHVLVTVTPPEGKTTVVSVNGGEGIVCANNLYAFRINENSDVSFIFEDKILNLTLNTVGDGTVECWSETPDDGYTTGGNQIQTGGRIVYGSDIFFWATPAEGKDLTAVSVTTEGETRSIPIGEDGEIWQLDDESGRYYMPFTVMDSIEITFTFSDSTQGIDEIGIDPANGPVEYYNLQGVRVDAENLAPGFYIVRQGSNAKKVFIQK